MIKQVEFIQDLCQYWISDKLKGRDGYWYCCASPIYTNEDKLPVVRVKIVFYYFHTNNSDLILDIPMTGLQFKWFRDWSQKDFPDLHRKLCKAFDTCFEIIGRQIVMKQSFYNLNRKYYGKYKGYKL